MLLTLSVSPVALVFSVIATDLARRVRAMVLTDIVSDAEMEPAKDSAPVIPCFVFLARVPVNVMAPVKLWVIFLS